MKIVESLRLARHVPGERANRRVVARLDLIRLEAVPAWDRFSACYEFFELCARS